MGASRPLELCPAGLAAVGLEERWSRVPELVGHEVAVVMEVEGGSAVRVGPRPVQGEGGLGLADRVAILVEVAVPAVPLGEPARRVDITVRVAVLIQVVEDERPDLRLREVTLAVRLDGDVRHSIVGDGDLGRLAGTGVDVVHRLLLIVEVLREVLRGRPSGGPVQLRLVESRKRQRPTPLLGEEPRGWSERRVDGSDASPRLKGRSPGRRSGWVGIEWDRVRTRWRSGRRPGSAPQLPDT